MGDLADIDALVAEYQARGGQPGLAYGVIRDGKLVHAGGLGQRHLGGPAPDTDTVFRIASMTKSFTAAAIVLLRDSGSLALDDPASRYVPELADWAVVPTIRQLLTMTAGLPTDDPWGDRQQGLPLGEFGQFLAGGVSFVRAPGVAFEYSNLGYAILGRVVSAASDTAYKDFVRDRLMLPLGMTRSGYDIPDEYATGYRRTPGGWKEVPVEPYGAFAPMGGVFTCVADLARWVAGFAGSPEEHPLSAASRREMQLPQIPTLWDRSASFPGDGHVTSYGFGLAIGDDSVLGRVVGHGGGYPGFGSYMRWHPATGTGVIAFGNSTYARMQPLTAAMLAAAVGRDVPGIVPWIVPWPATLAARDAVTGLLASWDDAVADRLFSPNVAQDAPFAERRAALGKVRERIGAFAADPAYRAQHDTPAHCRWRLRGALGTVQAQIQLTPEREPRVQSLTLAVPPAAGSPLATALDRILDFINNGGASPVADGTLTRRLRAAAAWAGPGRLAAYTGGDGETTTVAELAGEHAALSVSVTVDPAGGQIRQGDVSWQPR
jgi:CubicO group peptidase (beta-lactamase class C family)